MVWMEMIAGDNTTTWGPGNSAAQHSKCTMSVTRDNKQRVGMTVACW